MVHLPIRNGVACSKSNGCLLLRWQGLNLSLYVSLLWLHVWPSQPPFPFGPPHLLLSASPRALEAILSFSIDHSHLIQHILVLEFSIQKVSPISLVFKFWEHLNVSKSITISKASFSFQGSELERGASEYIPRSTWLSARHPPTISHPHWWWTGRPGVLPVHGVAKTRTRLSDWTKLNWKIKKKKRGHPWSPLVTLCHTILFSFLLFFKFLSFHKQLELFYCFAHMLIVYLSPLNCKLHENKSLSARSPLFLL